MAPEGVISTLIERLRKELPPGFDRKHAISAIPGWISYGGLCNLDAAKNGPPRVRCGKYCIYERESFLSWLESRLSPVTPEADEGVLK